MGDNVLKFPCEFPIKVMGEASLEFEARVLQIFRKHVPDLGEGAVTIQQSKKNNYISMTVVINATSQEQLDNIYKDLTDEKLVIMAL